jgi:hypothetical protein
VCLKECDVVGDRPFNPFFFDGQVRKIAAAGDRAGKPDGPPIADEAQSPARDRFGSCLGSADILN